MDKEESEFGRGLVICLVKFSEHFENVWARRILDKDCSEFFYAANWADGASDHLLEIKVPSGESWNEIREKVEELQSICLQLTHSEDSCLERRCKYFELLLQLNRELAVLIDKKIGIEDAEIGIH